MSTGQDFSEDITNGGFSSDVGMQNNGGGDEEMQAQTEESEGGMNQDDSMGAGGNSGGGNGNNSETPAQGNGEAMDHSVDTGSADQYGKDDDRKLFIGGLSWETTEKDLREYFTKYGGIESLTLKMDPTTGRSRGFAFIVFSEVATLDKVIAAGEHVINGKKVDPKKAKARHGKIFVGGLTQEISDDDIRNYFAQFGNVVEIEMPIDKTKNQRKGFCFITFDNEQIVHELLKTPKQTIGGKEVDVKKAQPPQNARGGNVGGVPWGPMGMPVRGARGGGAVRGGGRGRGRGDWAGGWGGGGYSGYTSAAGGYSSYGGGYGQNYGAGAARGYGYGAYGGTGTGYPYDYDYSAYTGYGGDYDYDGAYGSGNPAPVRGSSGRGRGGGGGGFPGKQRGGRGGALPRHTPY